MLLGIQNASWKEKKIKGAKYALREIQIAPKALCFPPVDSPMGYHTSPFQHASSQDPNKPEVPHSPPTKDDWWVIGKGSPKVTEGPYTCDKKLNVVIRLRQPVLSDLHVCFGGGQAKHWVELAPREHPARTLEKQTSNFL